MPNLDEQQKPEEPTVRHRSASMADMASHVNNHWMLRAVARCADVNTNESLDPDDFCRLYEALTYAHDMHVLVEQVATDWLDWRQPIRQAVRTGTSMTEVCDALGITEGTMKMALTQGEMRNPVWPWLDGDWLLLEAIICEHDEWLPMKREVRAEFGFGRELETVLGWYGLSPSTMRTKSPVDVV